MIYSSASTFAKQKSLWAQARQSLNKQAASDKPAKDTPLANMLAQINDVAEQNKLGSILTKMRTGKRLSQAEKKYLKENAPDTYTKYQMIEAERDGYRRQLKRAKSKEEADRLHQNKIVALSGELDTAKSTPDREYVICRAAAVNSEYLAHKTKGNRKHLRAAQDPNPS